MLSDISSASWTNKSSSPRAETWGSWLASTASTRNAWTAIPSKSSRGVLRPRFASSMKNAGSNNTCSNGNAKQFRLRLTAIPWSMQRSRTVWPFSREKPSSSIPSKSTMWCCFKDSATRLRLPPVSESPLQSSPSCFRSAGPSLDAQAGPLARQRVGTSEGSVAGEGQELSHAGC